MVALLALLVRVVLAPGAFAHPSLAAVVALAAFAGFAAWTLASSIWSDAPARALLEYDRTLLYGALLAIFVSLGRTEGRARVLVAATALGCAVVGIAALGPWLLPETFPIAAEFGRGRLNWPTSYWNATGLIAALGVVLCAHLASSVRDHPALRVLGSAAVPPLVGGRRLQRLARCGRGGADRRGRVPRPRAVAGDAHRPAGRPRVRRARGGARARDRGARRGGAHGRRARHGPRDGAAARRPRGGCRGRARAAAARRTADSQRWRAPRMAPWPARALGAGVVVVLVVAGLAAGGVDRVRDGWDDFSYDRGRGDHRAAGRSGSRSSATTGGSRSGTSRCRAASSSVRGSGPARARTRCCGSATGPRTATCSTGTRVYLETLGEMGIVGMALLGIALVADARGAVVAGAARPGPGMGRARRGRDRVGGPCGRRLGLGDAGRHRVGVLRGRPRAGAAGVGDGAARGAGSDRAAAGHPRRASGASCLRSCRCRSCAHRSR